MSKEKFKEKKTKIKKKNFFLGQVIQLFIKLLPQSVLDSLEAFMLGFFFFGRDRNKINRITSLYIFLENRKQVLSTFLSQ
jgi:hypothetical protein